MSVEKIRDELLKSLSEPFKRKEPLNNRSKSKSESEMDPEVFLKRITPQIVEVYERCLPYHSPQEWDYSFRVLGGGRQRRKSAAILERMTWDQFLYNVDEIIKEFM